ncbi:Extracellular serine proteinase [Smittium mucronatum]|uniref:Extracellular serine proteinase n=1 Tax=Smittium mucronatum TaxID=133383 RepID=A0A1R0GWW5_9FUNG|nr:Extracellular serine proteinase [Smittium mucronatum]
MNRNSIHRRYIIIFALWILHFVISSPPLHEKRKQKVRTLTTSIKYDSEPSSFGSDSEFLSLDSDSELLSLEFDFGTLALESSSEFSYSESNSEILFSEFYSDNSLLETDSDLDLNLKKGDVKSYLVALSYSGSSAAEIFESLLLSLNSSKFVNGVDLSAKYSILSAENEVAVFQISISEKDSTALVNSPDVIWIEAVEFNSPENLSSASLSDFSDISISFPDTLNEEDIQIRTFDEGIVQASNFSFTKDFSAWNYQKNAPWQLNRISKSSCSPQNFSPYSQEYYYPPSAKDVVVYVVDSGIDPNHSDFSGNVRIGPNFVSGEDNIDYAGHGTAIASTIGGINNGVSKSVKLVSVKVLDKNNTGSTSNVFQGLTWILTDKSQSYPNTPAIVNFSINFDGFSQFLDLAMKKLINANILVVSSAGDYASDACNYYPGSSKFVMSVASILPRNDTFDMSISNYGSCVDILSPGNRVFSAVAGKTTQIAPFSGTSIAAAIVSGVAALELSNNPGSTADGLKGTIISNGLKNVIKNVPKDTPNLMLWNGYCGPRNLST